MLRGYKLVQLALEESTQCDEVESFVVNEELQQPVVSSVLDSVPDISDHSYSILDISLSNFEQLENPTELFYLNVFDIELLHDGQSGKTMIIVVAWTFCYQIIIRKRKIERICIDPKYIKPIKCSWWNT